MSKNKRNKYKKQPPRRQDNRINLNDIDDVELEDNNSQYESQVEDADNTVISSESEVAEAAAAKVAEESLQPEESVVTSDEAISDDVTEAPVYGEDQDSESHTDAEPEDNGIDEPGYEKPVHKKTGKHSEDYADFYVSNNDNGEFVAYDGGRHKRHREGRKSKLWLIPVILLALLLVALGGVAYYEYSLVYTVVRVEAGVEVNVYDFLKNPDEVASFGEDSDEIDIHVPGEYHLVIMTGGIPHKATLYVEDTIAPVIEVTELTAGYKEPIDASAFVTKVEDATEVTYAYETEPDFNSFQDQNVTIVATDMGGNSTSAVALMHVSAVATKLEVEAGSDMPVLDDFLLTSGKAELVTNLEETVDLNKVGEYPVKIKVDGESYDSKVVVTDTVSPKIEADNIEGYANVHYLAEDFIIKCIDETSVSYSYESEPDYSKIGSQDVTIIATDEGGNTASQTVTLTLKEDTEAPVIEGAADITVAPGDTISYKANVIVRDNSERDVTLDVDSSKVKINELGTYPVTYTATDASGNTDSVTINVNVKEQEYSMDEVNAMADQVIAKIITAGMTKRQMCEAIYSYMHGNIAYTGDSVKGNYVRGAWEGFKTHAGDCYTFFCMTKAMLDRLGIANLEIERAEPETHGGEHYWHLVDIEDGHGWYHFDTTPRVGRPNLCLLDDATITAYSESHSSSHYYDRSKYPVVP